MIPKHIIDQIFEAARIEEVIGEFVNLKRSGSNLKGLSPFTDEKTPSFMVSPGKQIFKDFSSGKGGNVVTFLMEHEHYSYPEALKFLAKRYNIEIPEDKELTDEEKQEQSERESLYIVNNYAQDFFAEQLWETDEGKSVGLSYFKERGFSEETIKFFKLGYNPEGWTHFTDAAKEAGYKEEYLVQTGLSKKKDTRVYDAYRGRVMFPIHNLSGRVIGFGGRTLKTDKNIPKYINSPESLIYDKSKTLYGIYQAKGEIIKHDQCYLVEGYTDVISLHQAGVKNAVASSGTALTEQQIRLIKRYTQNVTILYDGDAAGIKASFRGIDMILKQGLNVRIVLFPDGEDPDSFAQQKDEEELKEFLSQQAQDFIVFKTSILSKEANQDPIQKAKLLKEVVASIALIPDHLTRAVYVKECAKLLETSEKVLFTELNKNRRKQSQEERRKSAQQQDEHLPELPPELQDLSDQEKHYDDTELENQERDIIRLLLNYSDVSFTAKITNTDNEEVEREVTAGKYIVEEVLEDEMPFENNAYEEIFQLCKHQLEEHGQIDEQFFLQHEAANIRDTYVDLIEMKYSLHNWEKVKINVKDEKDKIQAAIDSAMIALRSKRIYKLIKGVEEQLKQKDISDEELENLLNYRVQLDEAKKEVAKPFGIVIR